MRQLREHLARLYPGHRVVAIEPLDPDTGATSGATHKAAGYGMPVRVQLVDDRGGSLELVWRIASANEFGHDRRADRAAVMIEAFDDFPKIARHVEAIDLGAVGPTGELVSFRDGGEIYMITTYAPGTVYADDLRRVARDGTRDLDVARVDALARYAGELHRPLDEPQSYRRAVRDLIGSGEGIYGIVDGYPDDTPGAPLDRLSEIERRCAAWRWRLRESRLTVTHGDFHPFNIVFRDGIDFTVLDASRGACGDPADDVTAMMINFVLFAIDDPPAWRRGLRDLWHRFWRGYLDARRDDGLFAAAPPWFAWRTLVVCNPRFYPRMTGGGRDRLLGFAERTLDAGRLDPMAADLVFTDRESHAA
jgi:hypothetical protein